MTKVINEYLWKFITMSWLTGPIFEKELRVSSRRKRNYVLRSAYLALLTVFIILIWLEEVRYRGSFTYRASRMANAGRTIICVIIWFQFCATQLVALITMSTAISDEVYHKTLGTLMTTPINSFQIVMGKLFSKLLQLLLLIAITLPLLAVIRVLGGVPWDFIISSLCVNITTIIFVGSLSLFFSILNRRAYAVIIITLLTMGLIFLLLPFLSVLFRQSVYGFKNAPPQWFINILFYPNPYAVMGYLTQIMMNPRNTGGMVIHWPLHCAVMLAASTGVLTLAITTVRKVALRQATGQLHRSSRILRRLKKPNPHRADRQNAAAPVRRIKGSPILWKELKSPLLGRHKIITAIIITLSLLLLLTSYILLEKGNDLDDDGTHIAYSLIFQSLAMLFTIVLPATCITSEKEARSWPLLLATTVNDWHILWGKFVGTLRRCLPIWIFLFGHIVIFTFVFRYIHPIALPQMALIALGSIVFLTCSGLYFSTRFKRTTTAVIMNFTLAAVIWFLVPLLFFLTLEVCDTSDDPAEAYLNAIPFIQSVVVMDNTSGLSRAAKNVEAMRYHWPEFNRMNGIQATWFISFFTLGYIILGFFFAWRAKHRFRRNLF